jgi:hypothetical protein
VAQSPDRATSADRRSPEKHPCLSGPQETCGQTGWHGQETVPQRGLSPGYRLKHYLWRAWRDAQLVESREKEGSRRRHQTTSNGVIPQVRATKRNTIARMGRDICLLLSYPAELLRELTRFEMAEVVNVYLVAQAACIGTKRPRPHRPTERGITFCRDGETPNMLKQAKRREASTVTKRTLTVPSGRREEGKVIPNGC